VTTKSCPGGITVPLEQDCPKRDINLSLKLDQSSVCPGTDVNVSPASVLPSDTASQWTVNGEAMGQGSTFEFKTAGRSPGSYRIGLRVSGEGYNDATAETPVMVRTAQPPSGSLMASPAEIWAGQKATLSPDFRAGQCGGRLGQPTFTVTEGSVSGNEFDSTAIRFDPANKSEQRKTITVTAKVSDEAGTSTSAQTTVVVKKQAAIMARRLPDIIFPVGGARVNNCGKRVLLEQLKAVTDNDPQGKVVLVGHSTEAETKWSGLDEKRALNAAAVISAGQGVCSSFPANQIQVSAAGTAQQGVDPQPSFCGASATEKPGQKINEADETAKYRRVEVWFVPSGGIFPASVTNFKDATTLSVSSLGCPK
jgi:hypothetical protein